MTTLSCCNVKVLFFWVGRYVPPCDLCSPYAKNTLSYLTLSEVQSQSRKCPNYGDEKPEGSPPQRTAQCWSGLFLSADENIPYVTPNESNKPPWVCWFSTTWALSLFHMFGHAPRADHFFGPLRFCRESEEPEHAAFVRVRFRFNWRASLKRSSW